METLTAAKTENPDKWAIIDSEGNVVCYATPSEAERLCIKQTKH